MNRRLFVGIDPGVTTGFATWDATNQKFLAVSSTDILQAMKRVDVLHRAGGLHSVTFEDARLRTWFGTKGREALQGAGSIKRDSQIWAEFLGQVGCAYKGVSPQSKGAKVDAARFERLTGWTGRTNEHARDAAMLVLGMK
jgi:hypothetical protein